MERFCKSKVWKPCHQVEGQTSKRSKATFAANVVHKVANESPLGCCLDSAGSFQFYSRKYLSSGAKPNLFAAYGHSYNGERYVPVLMKDVAGLVPGACQGKGRGNRCVMFVTSSFLSRHSEILCHLWCTSS